MSGDADKGPRPVDGSGTPSAGRFGRGHPEPHPVDGSGTPSAGRSDRGFPQPLEWLEGRIERVVWAAPDGAYAVLKVHTEDGPATVVGPLASLAEAGEGTFVVVEGRWEEHAAHGRQLRAVGWLNDLPKSAAGIRLYLEGVRGIGAKKAAAIVDHFGDRTLHVLSKEPWRLQEVKGIKKAAKDIADYFAADERGRTVTIALRQLGLSVRTIERVRRRFGDRTADVVAREPYRLAEEVSGIGFRTADKFARAQGLPVDDPARIRAAVAHVVDEARDDGHCFLPRSELRRRVAALEVPVDFLETAVDEAASRGRVVVEPHEPSDDPFAILPPHPDDRIWPPDLHQCELVVAYQLAERVGGPPIDPDIVARAAAAVGIALDPLQSEAIGRAMGGGVSIVTGGPGTGKTTLVRVLLRVAKDLGKEMRLASPTGRAAKRLNEATGTPASTLHRLLGFDPMRGGFVHGAGQPIEGDGLVIDEVSMVDLPLFAAVLEALPAAPEFPVVLVGDADQLPSVGPGQILHDLLDSGRVPATRLQRVFRQGQDSGILRAAAAIQAGSLPEGDADDCFFLVREEAERAVETILQVVADRLPKRGFGPDDIQVLAPTRKGPIGTETLSAALQARLNPHGQPIKRGDKEYRIGDRVICTKNRYDVEVWNGDIGRISTSRADGLVVRFDEREIPFGWDELAMLDLAYAITVHKSQGSEYPAVVLALHGAHSILLRRNLMYTAVTRAKRFLCVIGAPSAWRRAASRGDRDQRWTGLSERLRLV